MRADWLRGWEGGENDIRRAVGLDSAWNGWGCIPVRGLAVIDILVLVLVLFSFKSYAYMNLSSS
jgi:hypothetical protein